MKKVISLVLMLVMLPIALAFDDSFSIRADTTVYDLGHPIPITLSMYSTSHDGQGTLTEKYCNTYMGINCLTIKAKLTQVSRDGDTIKWNVEYVQFGRERMTSWHPYTLTTSYDGGNILYFEGEPIVVTRLR